MKAKIPGAVAAKIAGLMRDREQIDQKIKIAVECVAAGMGLENEKLKFDAKEMTVETIDENKKEEGAPCS